MRKAHNKLEFSDVKKYVEDLGGKIISKEYVSAHNPLTLICTCGVEFKRNFSNIQTRKSVTCRKCSLQKVHKEQTFTHDQFLEKLENKYPNEYEVLTRYEKISTRVKVKHFCGYSYNVLPSNILNGKYCPNCSKRVKDKDTQYFAREVEELSEGEYRLLGEYTSSRTKTKFTHIKCGSEFDTTPNDFQQGKRCPICRESKGERLLRNYFNDNSIEFESQYKIAELKGLSGRVLVFDFAIFEDGQLIALVEYDGVQHFRPVKRFGGKIQYNRQKVHDFLKDSFCYSEGIKLIRIPYYDAKNYLNYLKDIV